MDVLAVLPLAGNRDGTIRNLFLYRTDVGLLRVEERQMWEAMERGQYRESRRKAARDSG